MNYKLIVQILLYVVASIILVGALLTFFHGLFLGLQVDPDLGNVYVLAAFAGFLIGSGIIGMNTWWLVKSRKSIKK